MGEDRLQIRLFHLDAVHGDAALLAVVKISGKMALAPSTRSSIDSCPTEAASTASISAQAFAAARDGRCRSGELVVLAE